MVGLDGRARRSAARARGLRGACAAARGDLDDSCRPGLPAIAVLGRLDPGLADVVDVDVADARARRLAARVVALAAPRRSATPGSLSARDAAASRPARLAPQEHVARRLRAGAAQLLGHRRSARRRSRSSAPHTPRRRRRPDRRAVGRVAVERGAGVARYRQHRPCAIDDVAARRRDDLAVLLLALGARAISSPCWTTCR